MSTAGLITRRNPEGELRRRGIDRAFRPARAVVIGLLSSLLFSGIMAIGDIHPAHNVVNLPFNALFFILSNTILLVSLYLYNFWVHRIGTDEVRKSSICLVGTLIFTCLFTFLSFSLETLIYGRGNTTNTFFITIVANLSGAIIAFLISQLLGNVVQRQRIFIENEKLQAENILSRYRTLQQQVQPHFLFNSLNTLDSLIGTDDESAHRYVAQLAANYRYIMHNDSEVTLEEELEFTHSYMYMMQIRHGNEHLRFEEHIDPVFLGARILPISLQLLVENAIKHNVISQRHPLTVTIATTPDGQLIVSNPVQPRSDSPLSNGIGLDNLSKRYQLFFHREISISATANTFSVSIPLIFTSTTSEKNSKQ